MLSLAGFAALAERVGAVPHVPQRSPTWGTPRGTDYFSHNQTLNEPVPLVPHVPLENNDAENELANRFEKEYVRTSSQRGTSTVHVSLNPSVKTSLRKPKSRTIGMKPRSFWSFTS